jgi:hypothetical protein
MIKNYYFDTCIWRDFYENRFGSGGRKLGEIAANLFMYIIKNKKILNYSDFIVLELKRDYNPNEIELMLNFLFLSNILMKIEISKEDYVKSKQIGAELNIPPGDVLHAIISKKSNSILVSQDNHMQKLKHLVEVKKPEEII